ncbi:MAG: BREX-1 system phosphatase PglZ type A [Candidatus Promineifilaceae bacterium]
MNRIERALSRKFEKHRIVFWYDAKQEMGDAFAALALAGVEKLTLDNNAFGIKYRMLRERPTQKFLVYHADAQPPDIENWLLDVQLAQGEFVADRQAMWLSELGLPQIEFRELATAHEGFFGSPQRIAKLKQLLTAGDTIQTVRLKMLAVCAGAEARIDSVVKQLFAELAAERETKQRRITHSGLETFLFDRLARQYGYRSQTATVRDFLLTLLRSSYQLGMGETATLHSDALILLKEWKDSVHYQKDYQTLAAYAAETLAIENDLHQRSLDDVVGLDTFEVIERKILRDLVRGVAGRTISADRCAQIVRMRRTNIWFAPFEHLYAAIERAAQFFEALSAADLTMGSLADGVQRYRTQWFRIDRLYRQFIYHAQQSQQTTILKTVAEQVEAQYSNRYLMKVNDSWQQWIDRSASWDVPSVVSQRDFFRDFVRGYLTSDKKIFVIISDGLRFECGEELMQRLRMEDRYSADMTPALTSLPSYTQLGMAALLPHEGLEIRPKDGTVFADGISTKGTANRQKILQAAASKLGKRATVVQAMDILNKLDRTARRTLIREHDVIYIYHNQIDKVGDDRQSEARVFDAVAQTLDELMRLIKRLAGDNAYNFLITADHGFIYQHEPLDESDFAANRPEGAQIDILNRRFVVGKGLRTGHSFKHFRAADVGQTGDYELLIPKSINRLRKQGAGSRYVHGGASLQEVIVPIVTVNKSRQSDVGQVTVDILGSGSRLITTNQLSVSFYQTDSVTAKRQPRKLRATIYMQDGTVISDVHELTFDFNSEDARERERKVRFVLTRAADAADGQDVILKLEEREANTSYYRVYKSMPYQLRRSFMADFDDF